MSNTPPHSFTDIYGQLVGTANPKNIDTKNTAPIIDSLLTATFPIEVIIKRIALEVEGSLSYTDKIGLATNPNRESILRGITKDRLRENYSLFIQYLRKVQLLIDIQKVKDEEDSDPVMNYVKVLDFQKLTLRDWIMKVEICPIREADVFREHFAYARIGELISGLQITDVKSFLNGTIISHIENAEKEEF